MHMGTWLAWRHHRGEAGVFRAERDLYMACYLFDFRNGSYWELVMQLMTPAVLLAVCADSGRALAGTAAIWMWWLVQATAHEWYHVPKSQRKRSYPPPVYCALVALEACGVLDTASHRIHHAADRGDNAATEHFFDMWAPSCLERVASAYWQWTHRVRNPTCYSGPTIAAQLPALAAMLGSTLVYAWALR